MRHESWKCIVYTFFSWTDFPNFREICYIDLTWWVFCWSRCPIWVQVIIQSQHHLQMVFLWFLCILWVVLPVIVTTCASSLVLLGDNYWLQKTGTTKFVFFLYGKKSKFCTSAHFCHFSRCCRTWHQWHLKYAHLLQQGHQTLHKDLTPFFPPKKIIDPELRRKHPRLQEVRSKDLFLQQVLVKEAVWIPRRDVKICVPLFFPKKKKTTPPPLLV